MTQFPPPEIWKRHIILLDIQARSANTKISDCLAVNLRTVLTNGNYEDMTADKKRTAEFVAEIQAMIVNDPSKSIRSIARDMEVSELLLR